MNSTNWQTTTQTKKIPVHLKGRGIVRYLKFTFIFITSTTDKTTLKGQTDEPYSDQKSN